MGRAVERRAWEAGLVSAALDLGWKKAGGGVIYRANDEYVFVLHARRLPSGKGQLGGLGAKPLALDPVFWEIIGSPELLRKRLAFRVNGGCTVPLLAAIDKIAFPAGESPAAVVARLNEVFARTEPDFRTLHDFEPLITSNNPPRNGQHLATFVTWWIAIGRPDEAARLVREAIASDLSGGFLFPGGTFEDLVLDHVGLEHERGHHVAYVDGRFRSIFPGGRWTPEQHLRRDLERMNGVDRFAIALWRLPNTADRRVVDERWDSDTYVQCAGGPDRFVIETRRSSGDRSEQLVVGHAIPDVGQTATVRRGDYTSTVFASEVFTRDEALAILLHYIEHDTVPSRLQTRELDLAADED